MTFYIKVGQKVYLEPVGSNARGWDGELLEAIISSFAMEMMCVLLLIVLRRRAYSKLIAQ